MSDDLSDASALDEQLDTFLELRKPGAHLDDDYAPDDFVLMLGVDLVNYPKFPKAVDDDVTFARGDLDIRQQLDVDSGVELEDYSGPYRPDLRYTDFSVDALYERVLPYSEKYLLATVDAWADEVAARYGRETMAEIEWAAWNDQVLPEIPRMVREFLPPEATYVDPNQAVPESDRSRTRVVYTGLFSPTNASAT